MRLIDAELQPPPLSAAAFRRTRDAVLAQMERERPAGRWRTLIFAGSALLSFAALSAVAREPATNLTSWFAAGAAALLATVLASASSAGLLLAVGACAASAGLVLLSAAGTGQAPSLGIKCLAIELFAATWPFGAAALSRGAVRRPSAPGAAAALAAAGALAGQASLLLTCPARHATPHLLAFHLGGVVLASAAGALIFRARPASPH